MHVLIACVHFRNGTEVWAFIDELRARGLGGAHRLSIAVCDNSGGLRVDAIAPEDPGTDRVSVYAPDQNLGYLRGAAYAAGEWVKEHGDNPDWVWITNTDVGVGSSFFANLQDLEMDDAVGVLGPHIVDGANASQNPFRTRRMSRLRARIFTMTLSSYWLYLALLRLKSWRRVRSQLKRGPSRLDQASSTGPRAVYAVHGASFLVRMSAVKKGILSAYTGFLYGEEIFVAEEARRLGYTVLYAPSLELTHSAHSTLGGQGRRRRWGWLRESSSAWFKAYY